MKIRIFYNTLLVRLHIRKVLPIDVVRKVKIKECKEELIPIPDKSFLILNESANIYGRKTIIEKLIEVGKILESQGYQIGVFEIYRDKVAQKNMRMQEYERLKKEYPFSCHVELEKILDSRISNITNNEIGGHQTGGAVDLTLCYKNGIQLDMGTKYLEFNERTKTFAKDLTKLQQKNRRLLLKLMRKVGFVNYPNEWWHFSYGDKMWAAYLNKHTAIYGGQE